MQSTLDLLAQAEKRQDLAQWARELGVSNKALYNAKYRGHLSPAIAGAVAEKLGLPVESWIVVAALESEKESACKTHMVKRFARELRALYLSTISAAWSVVIQWSKGPEHSTPSHPVSHAKTLR